MEAHSTWRLQQRYTRVNGDVFLGQTTLADAAQNYSPTAGWWVDTPVGCHTPLHRGLQQIANSPAC
jgi:hypothetical protein